MNFPTVIEDESAETTCLAQRAFLKPSVVRLCVGNRVRFVFFMDYPGGEARIEPGVVFKSSSSAIVSVDAHTGEAVMNGIGFATITATWQQISAAASVEVGVTGAIPKSPGDTSGNCCYKRSISTVLLVDNSRSMSGSYSFRYPTKLEAAKSLAESVAAHTNVEIGDVAVVAFGSNAVQAYPLGNDNEQAQLSITCIEQTKAPTFLRAALEEAISILSETDGDKVIFIFSDGQNRPKFQNGDLEDLVHVADSFKQCGGIIACVGIQAAQDGYELLRNLATDGYFINVYEDTGYGISSASILVVGQMGWYCGNGPTPLDNRFKPVAFVFPTTPPDEQKPYPVPVLDLEDPGMEAPAPPPVVAGKPPGQTGGWQTVQDVNWQTIDGKPYEL